jgi:hypothetical protein
MISIRRSRLRQDLLWVQGWEPGRGWGLRWVRFPVIDDPHDCEVTGIRLTTSRFTGGGATDADHPVSGFRTDRINSHLLGAAVLHHLKMLVLEIRNAVGGDERLDDLDDEHDQ